MSSTGMIATADSYSHCPTTIAEINPPLTTGSQGSEFRFTDTGEGQYDGGDSGCIGCWNCVLDGGSTLITEQGGCLLSHSL